MSLYLINLFVGVGAPLSDARIIDVVEPVVGSGTLINGCFPVRVPNTLQIGQPTNLGELITQKYAALLAYYAGFANIVYDDLLDDTHVSLAPPTRAFSGLRGNIVLPANNGIMYTTLYSLPWGGAFPGPSQAVVTWDVGSFTIDDPKDGLLSRRYFEQSSDLLTCEVTFNGGANWYTVSDGAMFSIPGGPRY